MKIQSIRIVNDAEAIALDASGNTIPSASQNLIVLLAEHYKKEGWNVDGCLVEMGLQRWRLSKLHQGWKVEGA